MKILWRNSIKEPYIVFQDKVFQVNNSVSPGIKHGIPLKKSTKAFFFQESVPETSHPLISLFHVPQNISMLAPSFLCCSSSCQSLPRSQITQQAVTSDSTSQVLGLQLEDITSHAREPTLEGDRITDSLSREVVRGRGVELSPSSGGINHCFFWPIGGAFLLCCCHPEVEKSLRGLCNSE
ncbi:hypothetical protein CEXT_116931 [Caerostris extrusa]|uniref:Uncharacterized protein n=1 Tax=Caerostris extrusa TaxID=172846 RepID=A0AAV4XYP1_CAEEX|nr:hypothetical protein CEXT_116931 [Caerostris extrusa]